MQPRLNLKTSPSDDEVRLGLEKHLQRNFLLFDKKMCHLPIPLQRERLHQLFQRQMRWVFSVEYGLDDRW